MLQVDEVMDIAKDAHLIPYVQYILEIDVREDLLFCKTSAGNANQ